MIVIEVRSIRSVDVMSDDDQTRDGPALENLTQDRFEGGVPGPRSFVLADLDSGTAVNRAVEKNALGIGEPLRVEFAAMTTSSHEIRHWQSGSLITFDEPSSAMVRVFLGEQLVARGELVEVDGHLSVRVVELVDRVANKAA
jgi:flagellar motor switch/type III secretory pathway protein FliN